MDEVTVGEMNTPNPEPVATLKLKTILTIAVRSWCCHEKPVKCSINLRIQFYEAKTKLDVNSLSL